MAHYYSSSAILAAIRFYLLFSLFVGMVSAEVLSPFFYARTCPNALTTIKSAVDSAVSSEPRMGASLLRLHFHDCFVQVISLSLSLSLSLSTALICLNKVTYFYLYMGLLLTQCYHA